jgi:hypothetical protein
MQVSTLYSISYGRQGKPEKRTSQKIMSSASERIGVQTSLLALHGLQLAKTPANSQFGVALEQTGIGLQIRLPPS